MWGIGGYFYNIPKAIFYLLKGDCSTISMVIKSCDDCRKGSNCNRGESSTHCTHSVKNKDGNNETEVCHVTAARTGQFYVHAEWWVLGFKIGS